MRPVTVNGEVDDHTIAVIEEFQRCVVKMSRPDGRVDPWGKTFLALLGVQDANIEPLVGAIFAESSSEHWGGGENADEKQAIGSTIVNATYYAKTKQVAGKKCYNDTFGNGTILSAIQKIVLAYNGNQWIKVMNGNRLKSAAELAKLVPDDAQHLELSIEAANAIGALQGPRSVGTLLGSKVPVGFNKAP